MTEESPNGPSVGKPAGWYPDPVYGAGSRWWDGEHWAPLPPSEPANLMSLPQPPGTDGVEPVLVGIGDIACTRSEVITPGGRRPVNAVTWTFTDMSQTVERIPVWAIILAVLLFWMCFLGLLFLLVKEKHTTGWVQITVQGDRFLHQTQLPVSSVTQVADYNARVSYARSLSTAF